MTIKMTEAELQRLGFKLDPENPSQAVPVKAEELPNDSWAFDRLMSYGVAAVTEFSRLHAEATCLSRRSTIQIFRAGRALSFARNKVPSGQTWGECLKAHGIPRTNAWEAIQLYERAKTEEAVALLSPTEAKHRFDITKPRKSTKDEETESPSTLRFPIDSVNSDKDGFEDVEVSEDICIEEDDLETSKTDNNFSDDDLADDVEVHDDDDDVESPESQQPAECPLSILTKITRRLEYLEEELDDIDWQVESRDAYLRLVDGATESLERIRLIVAESEEEICS